MKKQLLLLTFSVLVASPSQTRAAGPEDSVVRVFATVRYPNPLQPWSLSQAVEVFGSGAVIEGKKILTNAHLVLYATEVSVQTQRGDAKIEAKVEAVAPDMDLAVLTVKDPKFWENRPALPRAKELPKVQDNVAVYGFAIPSPSLAVTKGVVSRIDYGRYYQQGAGLVIQVTAAINPGSSGGPALVGSRMVGVVFGRLPQGQNIGYIIPNEEIDRFLGGLKGGRYDGKPVDTSGALFQRLENKALRSLLKLDDDVRGVMVNRPRRREVNCPFQDFDVLTKIGPYDIDNEGMVRLPNDLRLPFPTVIPDLTRANAVPVTLLRKGQRVEASLPVSNQDNRLIRDFRGEKLPYFIHGPLVFAPAKAEMIDVFTRLKPTLFVSQSPLVTRESDTVQFPDEELVVVTSKMFAHRIAKGYDDPVGQVVTEVNGVKVKNLRHLVETLRDGKDEYLRFRFAEVPSEILVFRRDEMDKATSEILEENGIAPTRRGSEDMLRVWRK